MLNLTIGVYLNIAMDNYALNDFCKLRQDLFKNKGAGFYVNARDRIYLNRLASYKLLVIDE